MNIIKNTKLIKNEALRLGFNNIGISKSGFLDADAKRLESWLKNDYHGTMSYMERNFDKRLDTTKLVEGSKSVLSLSYNYFSNEKQNINTPKISKYAYGEDYHVVVKDKLYELINFMRENIGDINGRAFVDSAPVLERSWAQKSGLGWIGKNGNLINTKSGSFFFLAELIIDIELDYDNATRDYCGTCNKCMEACPTQAIIAPQTIDGSKCISYFTIELKEQIPLDYKNKLEGWVFGCDICQDVCPWNRFSKPNHEERFNIKSEIKNYSSEEWLDITDEIFKIKFSDSPISRTGIDGIKRNIKFISLHDETHD